MKQLPHILKIGGNETNGLISIQVNGDKVQVISYPDGTPYLSKCVIELENTKENQILLCEKWDELNNRNQMISHMGLDIINE